MACSMGEFDMDLDSTEFKSYRPSEEQVTSSPEPEPIADTPLRIISHKTLLENIQDLRYAEVKHRTYNPKAEYVKYRKIIVDWMTEVGHEYQLTGTTTEMAVNYLDRILAQSMVQKNHLQLVSLACILVAAKHEEEPDFVPTMEDLNLCTNKAYTVDLIRQMEVLVLRSLNWHLNVVTPLHFLTLYLDQGIVFHDDMVDNGKPQSDKMVNSVTKYALFFTDLCIQEYAFNQYLPSLLAAGIIAASRRAVRVHNVWTTRLKMMTGYGATEVHACYKHIYSHYEACFPSPQDHNISPERIAELEQQL